MRQSAAFRLTLANGAAPLGPSPLGYQPRRAITLTDLIRANVATTRTLERERVLLRDASPDRLTSADIDRALDAPDILR